MNEWISVEDILPLIKHHVLTYEAGAVMPIKVNYIHNYENEFAYGKAEDITHWHALPESPK